MSEHRFNRYCARHGQYPAFRRGNITVRIAPGYISIQRNYLGPIYIPRSVLYPLLKWLVPLAREMDEDFDPEAEVAKYIEQENELHQELRRQKKESQALLRRQRLATKQARRRGR